MMKCVPHVVETSQGRDGEGVEGSRVELGIRVDLTQHQCRDGEISVRLGRDRNIRHGLCPMPVGHLGFDKTDLRIYILQSFTKADLRLHVLQSFNFF